MYAGWWNNKWNWISCCVPPGYSSIDVPRPVSSDLDKSSSRTNHGGVAAIITDEVAHKVIPAPFKVKTFESLCFRISSCSSTVVVLLLYRPGSQTITDLFFDELRRYLESIALLKCQILIAGDFNIHVERSGDDATKHLLNILASFDCIQHVHGEPTHQAGGTLDLVITKSEDKIDNLVISPPNIISDHSLISWNLPMHRQPPITYQRESRGWGRMDSDSFRSELLGSRLCSEDQQLESADEFFDLYHSELQRLADKYAPAKKVTVKRQQLAAWMDEECRTQRRLSRMLERRYRQNKTEENCRAWVEQEWLRHQIYRQKERSYWSVQLLANAGESRKLWRSMQQILGKKSSVGVSKNCLQRSSSWSFLKGR